MEETQDTQLTTDTGDTQDTAEDTTETVETTEDTETFSRTYVEKLRDENAKLRVRAQNTDELSHRLHRALVEQTGRLASPDDLEYDEQHLTDPEALNTAIDQLLNDRPYLKSRTPKGDVGQGRRGAAEQPVNFLGIMKMALKSG